MCYKNTENYLPGVERDLSNLKRFCREKNVKFEKLFEDEVNLQNFLDRLYVQRKFLNTIWICGHGDFFSATNYFLTLSDGDGAIDDREFSEIFSSRWRLSSDILLFIIDICHSGTFVDLPYEYSISSKSFAKTNNPKSIRVENKLVVCVSACRDNQVTSDSALSGGLLTSSILNILDDFNTVTFAKFFALVKLEVPQLQVTCNRNNIDFEKLLIRFE